MSTLTGLIGGGGGVPVVTSIPGSISAWTSNFAVNTVINTGSTSTLSDLVNINASGYLNQWWGYSGSSNSCRCVIILDGTTVLDDTAVTVSNDYLTFYPQTGAFYGTTSAVSGYGMSSIPLRFESSLRVRMGTALGNTVNTYLNYVLT